MRRHTHTHTHTHTQNVTRLKTGPKSDYRVTFGRGIAKTCPDGQLCERLVNTKHPCLLQAKINKTLVVVVLAAVVVVVVVAAAAAAAAVIVE